MCKIRILQINSDSYESGSASIDRVPAPSNDSLETPFIYRGSVMYHVPVLSFSLFFLSERYGNLWW